MPAIPGAGSNPERKTPIAAKSDNIDIRFILVISLNNQTMWIVLSNWALRSPCSIPRQVNGGGNLRPRLETHTPPELRRIVHRTVGDDEFHVPDIVNVFKRISVHNNQIRPFPLLDRSEERRVGKECRSRRSPHH